MRDWESDVAFYLLAGFLALAMLMAEEQRDALLQAVKGFLLQLL